MLFRLTKRLDGFGEITHHRFKDVLSYVANDVPVMLIGGTGSGKTHLCAQIAKALGSKFYFSNAVTEEYKLTGFTDANGKYHTTPFYDAFTEGGLFCLDEIDASIPETLLILNMALANGTFNFPCGIKEKHKDFKVVACANTYGGANSDYVGRSQLDKASMDRFAILEVTYDEDLEVKLLGKEVAKLLKSLRDVAEKKEIRAIFSTRAGIYFSKMQGVVGLENALDSTIFKDIDKEMFSGIKGNIKLIKDVKAIIDGSYVCEEETEDGVQAELTFNPIKSPSHAWSTGFMKGLAESIPDGRFFEPPFKPPNGEEGI